jgi:hypothetical protein
VRLLTYDVKIGDIRFSEFEIMKKGTRRWFQKIRQLKN